jgi:hypothetical protein
MAVLMLPIADKDAGAWYQDEPADALYSLLNHGVDTPDWNTYLNTEYYSGNAQCEFWMSTPGTSKIITQIEVRAYIYSYNSWQTWDIGLFDADDNEICYESGISKESGIISATVTGEWTSGDLSGCYAMIIANYGEAEPYCELYEIDCLLTVGGDIIPDTVRNETKFRCMIADNSAVIPLSNCNIQFRIEMKNSDGETLPAWESTDNPFTNGYDSEKCLYRLFLSGTVPGFGKLSEITAGLSTFSYLIFEYSNQTVNGEPDWNELTFVQPAMKTATPSYGAQSQSVSLYAERENIVSAYTWDYQEVDISGVSFRGPNQQGGKWTYNMAGLITGIKPGYRAAYNGESFVVGEIQWIINTTGIQTYLKEY